MASNAAPVAKRRVSGWGLTAGTAGALVASVASLFNALEALTYQPPTGQAVEEIAVYSTFGFAALVITMPFLRNSSGAAVVLNVLAAVLVLVQLVAIATYEIAKATASDDTYYVGISYGPSAPWLGGAFLLFVAAGGLAFRAWARHRSASRSQAPEASLELAADIRAELPDAATAGALQQPVRRWR